MTLASQGWVQLRNEFATSLVRVDLATANGPVLQIADPATGRSISLDPLELSALAWCRHDQLAGLLEPAFKEQRLDDGDFPAQDDTDEQGEPQ
ncbi:dihydrodiol dehydrogenase [Nocardia sp. NPDC050799]|uniref:dihydrodiol dehydrogenase n=1 Tax=Nocardia sp. NPDC050799 TaxID=3154842 RepID=UPI0033D2B3CC